MSRRDVERTLRIIREAVPDGVYRCECGHELARLDIDPEWWPCSQCNRRMGVVRPEAVR